MVHNLTLALLYDSGWYDVDFTKGENMRWGRGWGCRYAMQHCRDRGQDMESAVFCNETSGIAWPNEHPPDPSGVLCAWDRQSMGRCAVGRCPRVAPVVRCDSEEGWRPEVADLLGDERSSDSVCMQSTLRKEGVNISLAGGAMARCFRMRCSGTTPLVRLYGMEGWMPCDENATLQVVGYEVIRRPPQPLSDAGLSPDPGPHPSPSIEQGFIRCPRDLCGPGARKSTDRPPMRWEIAGLPPPPPEPLGKQLPADSEGFIPKNGPISYAVESIEIVEETVRDWIEDPARQRILAGAGIFVVFLCVLSCVRCRRRGRGRGRRRGRSPDGATGAGADAGSGGGVLAAGARGGLVAV